MSLSCKAAALGDNYCKDRYISNDYTIGKPAVVDTWQACMTSCTANKSCKAWTYNPANKQCSLKKQANFTYQKGVFSGPVEGGVRVEAYDCSAKSLADNKYTCETTIDSKYNLGDPTFKTSWSECRSACNGDTDCKAYTFTLAGSCQKKKLHEPIAAPGAGMLAGPRSTPLGGVIVPSTSTTTTTTTAATPTPPPATEAPSDNFLMKKSPLGVEWWIVIAVALVLGLSSCGMVMMLVMAGSD